MVDVEAVILDELGRLSPLGGFEGADWSEVIRRAGSPRRSRRFALAVAAAVLVLVVVAVSPLGAAIGREFGNFSDWLTGSPGRPASKAAQQAFDRANARAYAGFPAGTKLRTLIEAKRDGVAYTLSGFRDADSLCLTLTADGAANASSSSCAPLSDLRSRPQPALVLEVDAPVGIIPGKHAQIGPDIYTLPLALVSFGIVGDNVRAVSVRSSDGTRKAIVHGDAFLSIAERPKVGSRANRITATTSGGATVAIPFAQAPFGSNLGTAPIGTLHGPSHVDHVVHGATIGWLNHRRLRGEPLPHLRGPLFPSDAVRLFGRLLNPEPGSGLKVGIALYRLTRASPLRRMKLGIWVCYSTFTRGGSGGGCSPSLKALFRTAPFSFGAMGFGGSQYLIFSGVASDQVARMRVFLSTGQVDNVPLKDNAYVIRVAQSKFPVRVVAYDDHGRVIGIETMHSAFGGQTGPAYQQSKTGRWHVISRVTRADGRTVSLWAIPSQAAGGWCWEIKEGDGGGANACVPPSSRPTIRFEVTATAKAAKTAYLLLAVGHPISRVVIRYRSGATARAVPVDGLVLYALPASRVAAHDQVVVVDGYDAAGREVAHARVPGAR